MSSSSSTEDVLLLTLRGYKMKNVDGFLGKRESSSALVNKVDKWFGKSDPFFQVNDSHYRRVAQSKVIHDSLKPEWPTVRLPLQRLCGGNYDALFYITFYDWEEDQRHRFMGHVATTVNQVLASVEQKEKKSPRRSFRRGKTNKKEGAAFTLEVDGIDYGSIFVVKADIVHEQKQSSRSIEFIETSKVKVMKGGKQVDYSAQEIQREMLGIEVPYEPETSETASRSLDIGTSGKPSTTKNHRDKRSRAKVVPKEEDPSEIETAKRDVPGIEPSNSGTVELVLGELPMASSTTSRSLDMMTTTRTEELPVEPEPEPESKSRDLDFTGAGEPAKDSTTATKKETTTEADKIAESKPASAQSRELNIDPMEPKPSTSSSRGLFSIFGSKGVTPETKEEEAVPDEHAKVATAKEEEIEKDELVATVKETQEQAGKGEPEEALEKPSKEKTTSRDLDFASPEKVKESTVHDQTKKEQITSDNLNGELLGKGEVANGVTARSMDLSVQSEPQGQMKSRSLDFDPALADSSKGTAGAESEVSKEVNKPGTAAGETEKKAETKSRAAFVDPAEVKRSSGTNDEELRKNFTRTANNLIIVLTVAGAVGVLATAFGRKSRASM